MHAIDSSLTGEKVLLTPPLNHVMLPVMQGLALWVQGTVLPNGAAFLHHFHQGAYS